MLYKKLIEEYVTSENIVDMFMLTKLTDDFISEVDKIDHELVKDFVMSLKMYMHPCVIKSVRNMQFQNLKTKMVLLESIGILKQLPSLLTNMKYTINLRSIMYSI